MDNEYERFFSNWISKNLPPSNKWCYVTDIDFYISNYFTKKFMFLEIKTKWKKIDKWQRNMYNMIHRRLSNNNIRDWWTYVWTNLLEFNWENFYDWKVFLNKNEIDEYKLKEFLYFKFWF